MSDIPNFSGVVSLFKAKIWWLLGFIVCGFIYAVYLILKNYKVVR